jgi:hypothetical protein
MSDITICLPMYDPQDKHKIFLQEALESIRLQTLQPKEVLIGGSYEPTYLKKLLKTFDVFFPVRFIRNDSVSTSSNINALVPNCSGSIVKLLFQDDFFISNTSLASTSLIFQKTGVIWVACGSQNYDNDSRKFVKRIYPKFKNRISKGINSIGSPSVISFKKSHFLPFNENLVWMLDCEWYLQMQHKFGDPAILMDFQIANRLHKLQATNRVSKYQEIEATLVKVLHSENKSFRLLSSKNYCTCVRNNP